MKQSRVTIENIYEARDHVLEQIRKEELNVDSQSLAGIFTECGIQTMLMQEISESLDTIAKCMLATQAGRLGRP